jgi:hypothetical protein
MSRINKRNIASFRKQYGFAISFAQDYLQSVRNDSHEKRINVFLSTCDHERTIGSVTPFVGHPQLRASLTVIDQTALGESKIVALISKRRWGGK